MTFERRPGGRRRLEELKHQLEEHQLPQEAEEPDTAESEPGSRERARQMLVERKIEEAMADGAFDNLPGRGQPLPLLTNPYLKPGQELAFNLLQDNGFAPGWIERDQAIRRELEAARSRLRRAWLHFRSEPAAHEAAWQRAVAQFTGQLDRLNRQIDDLNLIVPLLSCQRSRLRLARELRRAQEDAEESPD